MFHNILLYKDIIRNFAHVFKFSVYKDDIISTIVDPCR